MQSSINSSVKMPPTLHKRVQILAQARKSSAHALMLEAIENYVVREEKREVLRQEALQAHEEFMLTGLHATGDEVDVWLTQLAEGKSVEQPKCHP